MSGEHTNNALSVDFGGVLTTSVWRAFGELCEAEGLAPDAVRELFRSGAERVGMVAVLNHDSGETLRRLEHLLGVELVALR